MTKPEYLQKYRAKAEKLGLDLEERHLNYAGMVQTMDESVMRITQALKEKGLDENTIIVYTADNGGDNIDNNGGLRERKGTAYEGGTRVCQFIRWKNKIEGGRVYENPVIHTDLYPTLLDLANIPSVPEEHLDGISLMPEICNNTSSGDRDLFWHYPHYHRTKPYSAIRSENLKLIEFLEDGKKELYDLQKDPAESKDLAREQPEAVRKLHDKLCTWRKSVGAQMMEPNPEYDPEKANICTGEKPKSPTFFTEGL
jgi:arylsulfatase A-like enzyme